jgi:hypothetical protein
MNMKQIILLAIFITLFLNTCLAQEQGVYKITPTPDSSSEFNVYIPSSLEDSFQELKRMLNPELIKKMQQNPEEQMAEYHMGLGLWMRNNWGLWRGSRLKTYFNGIGIFHPDDMSGIILDSFWRYLNSKSINLNEQVAYYQQYWKVNAGPQEKHCPYDNSIIEITVQFDVSEKNQPRTIHTGRCRKKKHYWAYEYNKGWYKPDAELLRKIKLSMSDST